MDERRLENLIARALEADGDAWAELCEHVDHSLAKVLSHPRFLGHIGQRENDRRNIILEVVARLHEDRFQRLKLYLALREQNQQLRFKTWVRILARRVGMEYLRGPPPSAEPPGPGAELLRRAARTVPEPHLSALELWVQSASYDEIASELELSGADEAQGLVNAATELLRSQLREKGRAHD